MSLISEALKKAHMEALRQESSTGRLYRLPGAVDMPERGSRRTVLATVVVSNLVVLSAIVIGAYLFRQSSPTANSAVSVRTLPAETRTQPLETTAVSLARPATAAATSVPSPAEAARPVTQPSKRREAPPRAAKPVQTKPSAATEVEAAPETVAETPRPLPRLGAKSAVADEVEIARERETPAPKRNGSAQRGLVNGRTYAHTARTSDGYELTLYGLSIAGDRGVALLNGRVLKEGDRIGDFTVGAIERGRVEILDGEFHIYLVMR